MIPYATQLLAYVRGNMPKGTDCEVWLDANVNPLWRLLTEQPSAATITITESDDNEHN